MLRDTFIIRLSGEPHHKNGSVLVSGRVFKARQESCKVTDHLETHIFFNFMKTSSNIVYLKIIFKCCLERCWCDCYMYLIHFANITFVHSADGLKT